MESKIIPFPVGQLEGLETMDRLPSPAMSGTAVAGGTRGQSPVPPPGGSRPRRPLLTPVPAESPLPAVDPDAAAPALLSPGRVQRRLGGMLSRIRRERPPAEPAPASFLDWLRHLEKGGLAFVYWNAAKLPIAVAIQRAARMPDGAIVETHGHRMLVVEPLSRPLAPRQPVAEE